jgi:outer membrane receptor protein involved in Fe transport
MHVDSHRTVQLRRYFTGACTSALVVFLGTAAQAQAPAAAGAVQEIVVTGSRIVREGYSAPTPLTVVSGETLAQSSKPTIMDVLKTVPAVTGARGIGESSVGLGSGTGGIASMNLRALGPGRVLVLIDGQRTVGSSITGLVDVSNIPQRLISRVDIVTGGASAVYGSDAVSGVVNFVLDKKFTGIKGEVSAGTTRYWDNKNYKVSLTGGFEFAGGRGHLLVSAEQYQNFGARGYKRPYHELEGTDQVSNPAYTATNGQPSLLFANNVSLATFAPGGLIVAGPLKGTAFGSGGTPYAFNYGTIAGNYMIGGDWEQNSIRPFFDFTPRTSDPQLFTRVSYDLTDDVTLSGQWIWTEDSANVNSMAHWLPGTATNYLIRNDNAFLPAATRAAMAANNVTSFTIGSWNKDIPPIHSNEYHMTNRLNATLEGKFNALGSLWRWNAYAAYGATKMNFSANSISPTRYRLAIDSVVNPANGQIICRSTLAAPTNGCRPWNPLGVGVNANNQAGLDYLYNGGNWSYGLNEQTTFAGSVSGDLFSLWAGPVSLALSAEHRTDKITSKIDPGSQIGDHIAYNFFSVNGKQSVSEGAAELLIPLAADLSWAKAWDVNLAARVTNYELAGKVTTWKIGTTFSPIDDIKFRFTRSRDIRAPTLQELFQSGRYATVAGLIDRYTGQPSAILGLTTGNQNLSFEKADTTSAGVVLSPRFLSGFTMSADYWQVKVKDAITSLSAQPAIDGCFFKTTIDYCRNITFNPDGSIALVNLTPVNLAVQDVRGLDLEATYRTDLADVVGSWRGNFSLHGSMSFYFKDRLASPQITTIDYAGANGNTDVALPDWKATVTAEYKLDPVTISLTGRGFSNGVINNNYFECASSCPASTPARTTINNNSVPGAFYLDGAITYHLDVGGGKQADVFLSGSNLLNKLFPSIPNLGQYYYWRTANSSPYEYLGAEYKVGIRFRM